MVHQLHTAKSKNWVIAASCILFSLMPPNFLSTLQGETQGLLQCPSTWEMLVASLISLAHVVSPIWSFSQHTAHMYYTFPEQRQQHGRFFRRVGKFILRLLVGAERWFCAHGSESRARVCFLKSVDAREMPTWRNMCVFHNNGIFYLEWLVSAPTSMPLFISFHQPTLV